MLLTMAREQKSPTGSVIDFSIPWRSGRVVILIDIEDDLLRTNDCPTKL